MTTKIFDRCMFSPTQGGLTDWTVSAVVQGYMTPAQAGVSNGDTVYYAAENADRSQWELGSGVYTSGSTTIARTTILFSSNANAKINFTSTPSVFLVLPAEYLVATTDATLITSDITTNNVSSSKHGFAPKNPNDASKYLDGTGAYSTPAGGGTALTEYEMIPAMDVHNNVTSFNSGFFGGRCIVMEYSGTINSIKIGSTTAVSGAKMIPAIYSNNAGAMNALLSQGPQVTNIAVGINKFPLTTPVSFVKGDILWIGIQVTVNAIAPWDVPGTGCAFFSSSSSLPNPATSVTYSNQRWASMWASSDS